MRIRDNAAAMFSTLAGMAGFGIGMVGWGAKALTPDSASLKAKTAIGTTAALAVGGATFAALAIFEPSNLVFGKLELPMYGTMADQMLTSAYAGVCAAFSYAFGNGYGDPNGGRSGRRTLNLR